MLRVGLLGAGFMGETHAAGYASIPDARLVAVADTGAEAAARLGGRYEAAAYRSADELLERERVDIVDICVPTPWHEELVLKAASRGAHILCEKPLALSLESADRMIAAVRKAGVNLMAGQVLRFWPEYVAVKEAMERGDIGAPLIVTGQRIMERPNWGSWFADPVLSGGALFDAHIHDLDFLQYLLGLPESVYCVGTRSEAGAWDHVLTTLTYPTVRCAVEGGFLMPRGFPFTMGIRVLGTAGCIEYSFRAGRDVSTRADAARSLIIFKADGSAERPAVSAQDAYAAEVEYFVRCVRDNVEPSRVPLKDVREVLQILQAARQSLETGQVVPLSK